jgi:hypothetical protein
MNILREDVSPVLMGQRFASNVCSTNVVLLDAGSASALPECGGVPMQPSSIIACSTPAASDEPVQTVGGLIYLDPVTGMALRCTRSGLGRLTLEGREMIAQNPQTLRCEGL